MFKFSLKSVEDVPVKRKFVIFFVLLCVVPFVLLTALFFILSFAGEIENNAQLLFWSFIVVGFFMLISFLAIFRNMSSINTISNSVKTVLEGKIPQKIKISSNGENEIVQIARSFNEVVQKLEGSIVELKHSKEMLQDVLTKVASGVSFTENVNSFLDLIMKTTVGAIDAKSGLLLLLDDKKQFMEARSAYGFPEGFITKEKRFGLDIGVLDWTVKQKKPLLVPRLEKIKSDKVEEAGSAFMPPLLCVPLVFRNDAIGSIIISGQGQSDNFSEEQLLIVTNIASQIAMAIVNAQLNQDAQRTYMETITALALAVEARDMYSRGHSDRVSMYSVKIAERLGMPEEEIKTIKEAGQMHDVGKIGISDDILRKPGPLEDFEFEIMRQHPTIGEGIILPLSGFSNLRDPIRHHHEWLNGQGYPDHLKGDEIPMSSRILAVADSYDAMTSDRPYRKSLGKEVAKQELIKYKGVRYDPTVVDVFLSLLE
jgi:hypothetical protein